MAAPASIDSFGNDVIATCSSSFSVLLPASSTWEYNDCARMISADSSDNPCRHGSQRACMGVTLFDELVVWQFDVIRGIAIGA